MNAQVEPLPSRPLYSDETLSTARLVAEQCLEVEELLKPATKGSGWRVLAFLVLIILFELALWVLVVPNRSEAEALAQAAPGEAAVSAVAPAGVPDFLTPLKDPRELPLGTFEVVAPHPAQGIELEIRVTLVGLAEAGELARLESLLERYQHRVRQEVLTTLRDADPRELDDPGLTLLKRKILAKTNRLLGTLALSDIVVSDFHCRQL